MKKGIIITLCVIGVVVFCALFTFIPDYYATGMPLPSGSQYKGEAGWASGGMDRFWLVLLCFLPVCGMVFCRFGKEDRWHFEEVPYRIARVVCCAVVIVANYYIQPIGPFSSALSFFFSIYPFIFLLYVFVFDGPFKNSIKINDFFEEYGLTLVSGGAFIIVIALSYILAPYAILLPIKLNVPVFGYDLPISAFACILLAIFEVVYWIISLPNNRSHSSNRTTNYTSKTSSGKLTASEMAKYAKKACAGTLSMNYEYISGNTIYISGGSVSDFLRELHFASGGRANTDGWDVVILNK